ncbi:MAG: type II toxin-antitoxin system PemK/MazF family toxin [Flavobacteriales bacterium]|nr:type II toxin-antitoxin system PemK/MazF family toxin [Flavobacteriales bacterium]
MKREVVIIPFPFSDLSGSKRRPALVVADWGGEDVILCQITSKTKFDGIEVGLESGDFQNGKLPVSSNIRPNKIFTADRKTIIGTAGRISETKFNEVRKAIVELIQN